MNAPNAAGHFNPLEGIIGFRIFRFEDVPQSLPQAVAVSIPVREVRTNLGGSRARRQPRGT